MHRSVLAVSTTILFAVMFARDVPNANADEAGSDECLSAYENVQLARKRLQYQNARDFAKKCSGGTCHAALRTDCIDWLSELDKTIPSVVIEARSPKGEETEVRVTLDGNEVTSRLDGSPIEIDPGPHTFVFELKGWPKSVQKTVIKAGEKLRVVSAVFGDVGGPRPNDVRTSVPVVTTRPVPSIVYVMGGIALAGAAGFSAFAVAGNSKRNDLESECAPFCSNSDRSSVSGRYLVADISLGIGLLAVAAGTYFYLSRPEVPLEQTRTGKSSPTPDTKVEIGTLRTGIFAQLQRSF